MTKRKQPLTSILAHDSVKPTKEIMYAKILKGLEKLKTGGTFYETAQAAGLKPDQVWKRQSEMQALGLIFNVGITRKGASGRLCSVWQITGHLISSEPPAILYVDKSKEKPNIPPKNNKGTQYVQNDLFFNTQTASWDNTIDRQ